MTDSSSTEPLDETLAVFGESCRPWTTAEVADCLDLGRRGTYARLERLVEQGRLETKKVGGNTRVWWRTTADADPDAGRSVVDDALDGANVGAIVLDDQFEVVRITAAAARYFGLDREQVVGRDGRQLLHEQLAPRIEDADRFVRRLSATDDDTDPGAERVVCRLATDDEYDGRWLEHRSTPIDSGRLAGGRVELYDDVTEREQSEETGRATREELASMIDAVEEYAIFRLDRDGRVRTWNAGAERIKGYTADEIRGEHYSAFYTEADREVGLPEWNLADAARQGTIEDEGWRIRADGSRFWAEVTITAVRNDEGALDGYLKIVRDTTEQRHLHTERELLYETTRAIAEAETFDDGLRTALEAVCDRTEWEYGEAWIPTDDGTLRRAEPDHYEAELAGFAAFSEGYTLDRNEGLPGRVWASGQYEWAADLSTGSADRYPRVDRAREAGLTSSVGVPIVANGEVITVLTFLMRDARQTDTRMIEIISSVAAELGSLARRRRVEAEIERERNLVDRILETSPVGITVLDGDGEPTRINERARELFGTVAGRSGSDQVADGAVYDSDGTRLPPEERPSARVLDTGEPVFGRECRVELPDGTQRWLSVNAAPIYDDDGTLERVITTEDDITRLKQQAQRLERQRDELEAELADTFARISDGVYALDSDLQFTFVNDRAAELLDVDATAVVGRDIRTELSLSERFEATLRRALDGQRQESIEVCSGPLGTWFECRIYPSETGLSVYFRDVTERKRRERELEESRRIYRTLVDNVPNGAVALVDDDLRYLVFGGTPIGDADPTDGPVEGERVSAVLDERAADLFVPRYEAALRGERPAFVYEADDRFYRLHFTPVRDAADEVFGAISTTQDITEQKQRERELEARVHQQNTLVRIGRRALETHDVDELLRETTAMLADTLDSCYCAVLDLDAEAETLLLRQGVGWDDGVVGASRLSAVETESQVAATLTATGPVVVEDLDAASRFSGPELFDDHGVRSGISTIIGPRDDPWGVLGVYHTAPQTFSDYDATFVQAVANTLSSAISRHATEQAMRRQRRQLSVLNHVNEVVQQVTSDVIDHSTRAEIQAAVCDRFAASDSYSFAWIGEVDPETDRVTVRADAGADGYVDDITVTVDPTDERSTGPTGRALNTGEIQTVSRVDASDRHDPWREAVDRRGFNASAAIPLKHEGTVYGVLNVYTERMDAFGEAERTAVGRLGEIIGHAIAAVERKQALVGDELVELGIRIEDFLDPAVESGEIVVENTVRTGDGRFLIYGTATAAVDSLERLVAEHEEWEQLTLVSDGTPRRFELVAVESPILSTLASLGGYIERAIIEEGDLNLTVHLTPNVDVRDAVDRIRRTYPQAEMLRRRQINRSADDFTRSLLSGLTDRQQTTLEAAYAAGFFEWPRDATGEEVAASMGVSPPTFHQHLRKAERKVFESLFSTVTHPSE
jgi:PAS domain S-box-containing protein